MTEIKQKILIIDDSQIDLPVSALLLKNQLPSADVYLADSAASGLEWLKNHQNDLADGLIILLDVRMPEMDGFDFLNTYDLMSDEIKNKTCIFLLSSTLDPYDLQKAQDNKYVKTILSKPLPVDELLSLIGQMG